MKHRNIIRLLFFFLSGVSMINFAFSQPQKPKEHIPPLKDHNPPLNEDSRWNRIEDFKKIKMIEKLNLNEEESTRFFVRHNAMINEFKEIEKQKNKSVQKLEKMLSEQTNDSDIKKELDNFLSIEQKMFKNKSAFINDIEKILGQRKVANYIIFENNFHKELQKIMRESRKPPFEKQLQFKN